LNADVAYDEDETTQTGSGVSGFEVLQFALGADFDVDELSLTNNAGITNVVLLGAGSYTNATALTTLTQAVAGAFETDLATDGSADALTVNLVSSAAAGAVTSALTAGDVEALTVTSTGTAANTVTMSAAGSLDLTSITASGTQGLTLNISGVSLATVDASGISGTGNAFVLDAASSTADMTVTGSAVRPTAAATGTADIITTGSGDDTITGGVYKDIISAGAGDDTIVGGDGNNDLTGGAGDDTITGGADDDAISDGAGDDTVVAGAGVDTITMGAGSDDIDAGAGKDVIIAGTNLSSGDDIDGGADADTLSATLSGVGVAPTIASVETLAVTFGASTFLDMENVTGVTSLTVDGSAGITSAQIKNLVSGTTVTATDDASLAGVAGNLLNLTVDTAADATLGIKIAANDNAATAAASALGAVTITDAVSVAITNEGGTTDNVLGHTLTSLLLDDAETTSLSITTSAYGGLSMGTAGVTGTSELTSFTLSAGVGSAVVVQSAAGDAINDAAELQTISVSATGAASTVDLGAIGVGTPSTALTDITLAASAGGTIAPLGITASANLSSLTITADGSNSSVIPEAAITTTGGGISQVTITASDRGNVDMSAGDLTVGAGLISGLAISASGRGSVDLAGFLANSSATGTAGAYSITTGTRGTIDMGTSAISTGGSLTSLTVTVGEDSTLTADTTGGGLITAAGTIGATTVSVESDAATSGQINIGQTTTVHTLASINLSADAANVGNIDLIGATATKLTVTLDGSTAISVAANVVGFDSNPDAISYAAVSATTALVFNASASTGTNSLDFSTGGVAKVTVTGGTGADTIVGTTGNDVISGGADADTITGGAGADTITGGTGNDTFSFNATDSATVVVAEDANDTGEDTIEDFASGDLIQITGELATGFDASTDVLVGTAGDNNTQNVPASFAATAYIVARDGDITNGFDTVINVTSDGATAAFANGAAAQAATVFNVTLAAGGSTVTLGANNDTVIGGTGADTITGGAGADTITGGTGADVINVTTGDTGLTLATADTINGFATASDTVAAYLTGAAEGVIADGSALATFAAFVAAADAVFTAGVGANNGIYISYNAVASGNAYVAIDEDDSGSFDAGDTLLVLTGITLGAEIALTDFV